MIADAIFEFAANAARVIVGELVVGTIIKGPGRAIVAAVGKGGDENVEGLAIFAGLAFWVVLALLVAGIWLAVT